MTVGFNNTVLPPNTTLNFPVLPGLPQLQLPGAQAPVARIGGDQNAVTTGGFGAGVSGNGFADIDNIQLDNNEMRALDNLMQTYLADGKFTPEEQKTYQEVRSLFARGAQPAGGGHTDTPTTTPTTTTPHTDDPAGGGVTPTTPHTEWPVGDKPIDGRTFKSWGDPHEVTGDGLAFDNMKQGTFTKLKSASGDFELQTTQGKDKSGRWPNATLNQQAAVKSGNDTVKYDGLTKTMSINGKATPIPANGQSIDLPGGGKVVGTADGVQIQSAKGDKVNIHQKDAYIDISGEVSAERKDGEVRGSLGNFDADTDKGNEMMGRTGNTPIKGTDAFLEEWRVKPGQEIGAENPGGGAGPTAPTGNQAAAEADFAKLDITGNGYLSGTEITPELKAAFPNATRITKEEFVKFQVAKYEAADAAEFTKRDVNQDGQLDGNEVGDAAAFDKGNNFKLANGTSNTEISKAEFMAGRAAARGGAAAANPGGGTVKPADPAGGGVPTEAAATVKAAGDDVPAIANARTAKRKKRKGNFFQRLVQSFAKMAGNTFRIVMNITTQPIRTVAAAVNGVANVGAGGNPLNAVQQVAKTFDFLDGIKL